jgi:hypothetical protein
MEKFEEKIIDLVDVIAEPDPKRVPEAAPVAAPEKHIEIPSESGDENIEKMVREEVDRVLRSMVGEHIQGMIKEILSQEIEKAIAREIEGLKKTK